MADHTITIQSKGLGDPIRTSQNEGKSGEKIIAEEIKKLLTQMRTDRPETTHAEAQRKYWEDTQATRHARNMGSPMMEGSPDDGYQLAGEYKLAGESQSEPRPQSDEDIAAIGFLQQAQEAAAEEAEVAALMKEAAQLLLKFQEGGIESLTEEETHTLDKARESASFLGAAMFGGQNASGEEGYYGDWRAAKHAFNHPTQVEDPDTPSLAEEEKHDDREDAIEEAIGRSAAGSSGDSDNTNVDDDFAVDDILNDVSESIGTAASSVPFLGSLASGITKGITSAISLANRTLSTAANVVGGVANTGLGVAGAAAGVVGTSNNPTQSVQAMGSAVTSVTGALASATKGAGFINTAFENLNVVIGTAINVFGSWVAALEKASDEVMGFNPNILMERLGTEIMVLQKQIARANAAGDELAEFESARGDFISVMEDIKTLLIKVFAPIVTSVLKTITQFLEEYINNIPMLVEQLVYIVESIRIIAKELPIFGRPIAQALEGVKTGIRILGKRAEDALKELKDKEEKIDVGFGNWLLGSGSNPNNGVAGINPGRMNIR